MTKTYTYSQAMAEAARCLLCHEPPCSAGCPANTDPGKFIRQMRFANLKGAIATMKTNNMLAGACGVLCPTCSLCASGCTAEGLDRPIDIGGLQRFLADYAREIDFFPLKKGAPNGHKVAIVGAGPAGLQCATILAQEGFEVVIFEALNAPGGVLKHMLPPHRLPPEMLDAEVQDVLDLGVEIRCDHPIVGQAGLQQLLDDGFDAIFMATGAWQPVRLGIDGDDAKGVLDGVQFLMQAGQDLDALKALLADKEIAVVGGGDTAMDVAVTAAKAGAKDVYVLYRRSFKQMPGDDDEKLDALNEGVHFVVLTQPLEYVVEGGAVTGVKVIKNHLGDRDASGRRRPLPMPGTEHTIPVDLVVEAIGLSPTDAMKDFTALNVDDSNRIVVTPTGGTGQSNVFAGGDAVRGASLISHAICDGRTGARRIIELLQGGR
jgi:glutamate synthase (NADPH) small chain